MTNAVFGEKTTGKGGSIVEKAEYVDRVPLFVLILVFGFISWINKRLQR